MRPARFCTINAIHTTFLKLRHGHHTFDAEKKDESRHKFCVLTTPWIHLNTVIHVCRKIIRNIHSCVTTQTSEQRSPNLCALALCRRGASFQIHLWNSALHIFMQVQNFGLQNLHAAQHFPDRFATQTFGQTFSQFDTNFENILVPQCSRVCTKQNCFTVSHKPCTRHFSALRRKTLPGIILERLLCRTLATTKTATLYWRKWTGHFQCYFAQRALQKTIPRTNV